MLRGVHLIVSTYGSWLPGDERGHWSPLFDLYHRVIQRGGRLNLPDSVTRRVAISQCAEPPVRLDMPEQALVGTVVGQVLKQVKLRCVAAAVEPTHMHLQLEPTSEPWSKVVGQIKGRSSSAVLQLPGNAARRRTWSTGYWKVFLFDDHAMQAVRQYIESHNTRRNLPAQRFPFVTP